METKELTGRIFDIQRMSLHDGPGIRTTVFFKGCSLRCFWCHNPESIRFALEIQYFPDRCIGCGLCREACELGCHQFDAQSGQHLFQRERCISCGRCAGVCPAQSLVLSGKDWQVEALVKEVLRDRPFYEQSQGGVTASGGEPLLQPDFVACFFHRLHQKGIHTALETALYVPEGALQQVLPEVDFLLADLKYPEAEGHRRAVGADNEQILKNLQLVDQSDVVYCVRIPVIPGVNDQDDVMRQFEAVLRPLKRLPYVELMPYHDFGLGKYDSLARDSSRQAGMTAPTKDRLIELAKQLHSHTVIFRNGSKQITVNGGIVCER